MAASASVASFLAVVRALKKSGCHGRVRLVATPVAGDGGKLQLIGRGAYSTLYRAMSFMVYPIPANELPSETRDKGFTTARGGLTALDTVYLTHSAISALSPQLSPYERIHSVLLHDGTNSNITSATDYPIESSTESSTTPTGCVVEYDISSDNKANAESLWKCVEQCFQTVELVTSCRYAIEHVGSFVDVRPSKSGKAYAETIARKTVPLAEPVYVRDGSSDVDNSCCDRPLFTRPLEGQTDAAALQCAIVMAIVAWKVIKGPEWVSVVSGDLYGDK
jgi:metal-dependent amidase/aminoacylase/carboxypeptidase family protein